MDTRNRDPGGGFGMNILIGFVFFMYATVALLLLWFCSSPMNWDKMKKRWYVLRVEGNNNFCLKSIVFLGN